METVNKIIAYLDGKKTIIISAIIVVFNALCIAGAVTLTPEQYMAINSILAASGLTTLRVGMKAETKKIESDIEK